MFGSQSAGCLLLKLSAQTSLTERERSAIQVVERQAKQRHRQGGAYSSAESVALMSGWAARHVTLGDGRRQLVELMVPGDFIFGRTHRADPAITFLSPAQTVPAGAILSGGGPGAVAGIAEALRLAATERVNLLTSHMVRLGRQTAMEKFASLALELEARLERVNLMPDGGFDLPMTQELLGDYLGLSTVHINRTLQHARRMGWIKFQRGIATIINRDALVRASGLDVPDRMASSGSKGASLKSPAVSSQVSVPI